MIKLEKYNEDYLNFSWDWLNDPETKYLTNTNSFTKDDQLKWFDSLEERIDYKIWGVSYNEIAIGVFGIKNIDFIQNCGEYWGYIGEKKFRGKGLGKIILKIILEIASNELMLEKIYLKVLEDNNVAINLYKSFDFKRINNEGCLIVMKKVF